MNAVRNALLPLMSLRGTRDSHPGLLLQRYLHESATGDIGKPEHKRQVLDASIDSAMNTESQALYRAAYSRWKRELDRMELTAANDLQTQGRLIVGLGSENVLETGIRLHHTYGMPILPGSALKGLAAHYCDQVWGPTDKRFKKPTKAEDEGYRKFLAGKGPKANEDNFHRLLFGNTDDNGCITFHDAWYIPDSSPRPLVLDVMTPHHPKWLDGSVPPTDFDSPVPVPFLSVSGRFRVAVSWHGPASDKANNWTELARSLLCDALKDWGVGGKTSSGYGRLIEPETTRVTPPPVGPANPPSMPVGQGSVKVTVLERREAGGKVSFIVQEEGKQKGVLMYGKSPENLPEINSTIVVYRNNNDPRNPQYRWDPPPSPAQTRDRGKPKPRR